MTVPLSLHLDLNFQDSCNCLCFRSEAKSTVYIDEDLKPIKYCKKIHNGKHIEATYKRIEQIIHMEFDSTDLDNQVAVQMVEKMTRIPVTGDHSKKEPIKVRQLRALISAIQELNQKISHDKSKI